MLSIEAVSKRYKSGNYGVRDVTLRLTHGVVGLIGPNGAGKTTLMQMIAAITRPTSGRILYRDVDISRDPDVIRRRLGYLPQDFGIYENLTAREFLSYFAALKGVHDRRRIDRMLETVNLHTVAGRTLGGFSGGMRQRLGIAQALINDPELIIVDEPTAGLDPEERVRFRNILSGIGIGKLVILSTHIVSDIESVAAEIAVLKEGGLLRLASPEELLQSAAGSVWEMVVPSPEFDRLRGTLRISSAVSRADGVHLRVVSPTRPPGPAVAGEPTLEDAFLFLMNFGAAAAPAAAGGASRAAAPAGAAARPPATGIS